MSEKRKVLYHTFEDKDGNIVAPLTTTTQVYSEDGTPLKNLLNDEKVGDLKDLTTTAKNTAVDAINEVNAAVALTASSEQGQKADTAVQSVKIGSTEYKSGTNVVLPEYPTSLPASDVADWAKADNKPSYTAAEVGALADTTTHLSGDIAATEKGTANGVATLDSNGLVPAAQLPSFVDDVLEYATKSAFPATGESGKIYVDKEKNLTYRWGGSAYVEISPSLALGETSSTAYAGDKGKANATAIAAIQGQIGSYTLAKSVPADAVFTDTNTWRPLGTGASDACAGNDSRLSNARPASDVYSWAKASNKPTYTASEVGALPSTTTIPTNTNQLTNGAGFITGINKDMVTTALGYTPPTTNTTYSNATTSAAGLMSAADKTKLNGIATGANAYSLPKATSSTLGGVKIGSNITVSSGTISLTKANVTSALGYTPPTTDTNTWRGITDTYTSDGGSSISLSAKGAYNMYTALNSNLGTSGIYTDFSDKMLYVASTSYGIKAAGTMTVLLLSNKRAMIIYDIRITANGTANAFDWGLSVERASGICGKTITPVHGGFCIFSLMPSQIPGVDVAWADVSNYGTVNVAGSNNKYWGFARNYDLNHVGTFPANMFVTSHRMYGIAFGTYQ